MKHIYISILFLFSSYLLSAQTIHIKLIDGTTEKPISGVKIKSGHDHDLITFSNDSGYFAFNVKHNDTILFQKDYYYPVFMSLKAHNFDSTHVIKIQLIPSATIYKGSNQFSKMNLQAFEYQFVHDEVGDNSKASITLFQTPDALKTQQVWTGKPFRFVTIDVFPHAAKSKSHYIMAQPEY